MADYGMCYNGSGYKDETAYKAIMGAAKPGDVWTEGEKLVLILKNQGAFCNVLMLREEQVHSRMIEIISGKRFFTDPAMVKFTFCERLGQFVQKLPRDEFARVIEEVTTALDFAVKPKSMREMCHELLDEILDRAGAGE
jgi:hypothetical protein